MATFHNVIDKLLQRRMIRQLLFKDNALELTKGFLIEDPKDIARRIRRKKMVDISTTVGKQYLKADYVKSNDVEKLTITEEPVYEKGKFGDALVCTVDVEGQEFKWNINPTTQGMIAMKHGNDSKNWVDKVILLKIREIRGNPTLAGVPE